MERPAIDALLRDLREHTGAGEDDARFIADVLTQLLTELATLRLEVDFWKRQRAAVAAQLMERGP